MAASAGVAWGADPKIAQWPNGIGFLCLLHRLQPALIGVAVACGMTLAGLVSFGKRRPWWLIGLAPIAAAFVWRFALAGDGGGVYVDDQPVFASAAQSGWLGEDDPVIGVESEGAYYAYPIAAMAHAPIVVQSERPRRLVVIWSSGARAATAAWVERTVRGRDLEVVTTIAGVPLIYNRRLGEFFDALTFRTTDKALPKGLIGRVAAVKTTWGRWRSAHPETLVLQQRWKPAVVDTATVDSVAVIATEPPIATASADIAADPLNLSAGPAKAVVFRGDAGEVRAFERRVDDDLFPHFMAKVDRKTKQRMLVDGDSGSTWNLSGVAVEGPLKGSRLTGVIVIEDVSASAAKFWIGEITKEQ
jgi:hypothetical protein